MFTGAGGGAFTSPGAAAVVTFCRIGWLFAERTDAKPQTTSPTKTINHLQRDVLIRKPFATEIPRQFASAIHSISANSPIKRCPS
jgi:hypothetical protein